MRRSKLNIILLLMAIFWSGQSFAQRDSISALLEEAKAGNEQLFEEINLANGKIKTQPDAALAHLSNALKLSFKHENKRGEAFTYYSLGAVHYQLSKYTEAKTYFDKSENLFAEIGETSAKYDLDRYMGLNYEALGDYTKAEKKYKAVLAEAKSRGDSRTEFTIRSNLGRLYFNKKKYLQALQQYQLVEQKDPLFDKITVYENIGQCYNGLRDTTKAIEYFKKADLNNPLRKEGAWSARYYENVSQSHKSVGNSNEYIGYQKKARSMNRASKDGKGEVYNNVNIANELLLNNRAKTALPYIKENIDLSERLGELKENGEAYRQLSEAYEQIGEMEKARESFQKYKEINSKLMDEREKELTAMIAQHSTFSEKEKEIALLVKERELDAERIELLEEKQAQDEANFAEQVRLTTKQKRINYILISVLALLLLGVLFLVRSSRQKRIANQLLAIRSLRSQMNPHFIFNSLNSVNSFISKSDNRSANKYLTDFAKLMRLVLKHSQQDFVSLEDEIEVIERYLRLEHLRFEEQFDYELDVNVIQDQADLFVPPMLIQPFIENAIWHGLRYKKTKGFLKVKISSDQNMLDFVIEDNGIGREESQRLKTEDQKSRKSTGMSNTEQRIELLNEVNRTEIEGFVTDLDSEAEDVGTRVELYMPIKDTKIEKHAAFEK